ncbi:MAG: molybdate ABC transporter substrate-binding protein [Rhodospirillaceae bacterium]|nr:molybdate ABC transporter substrate-binding protein [Rhodospirillaceae bacterium]
MPRFALRLAALAIFALAAPAVSAQERGPLVFAAASLKNALDDIAAAWQRESGKRPAVSYAGSSALAKQIAAGAPADLFISADLAWMDFLAKRGLVAADKRVNLLANRIVLIAPADSKVSVAIGAKLDLAPALGNGRLAMANADAVPAGKYGKAALMALGAWDGVKDRVAQAQNVRAALLLVARGEAPLGIVYRTDAAVEPKVKIVALFPEATHPPIVYPAAVLAQAKDPAANAFFAYLRAPAAKAIFERYGFAVLNAQTH